MNTKSLFPLVLLMISCIVAHNNNNNNNNNNNINNNNNNIAPCSQSMSSVTCRNNEICEVLWSSDGTLLHMGCFDGMIPTTGELFLSGLKCLKGGGGGTQCFCKDLPNCNLVFL